MSKKERQYYTDKLNSIKDKMKRTEDECQRKINKLLNDERYVNLQKQNYDDYPALLNNALRNKKNLQAKMRRAKKCSNPNYASKHVKMCDTVVIEGNQYMVDKLTGLIKKIKPQVKKPRKPYTRKAPLGMVMNEPNLLKPSPLKPTVNRPKSKKLKSNLFMVEDDDKVYIPLVEYDDDEFESDNESDEFIFDPVSRKMEHKLTMEKRKRGNPQNLIRNSKKAGETKRKLTFIAARTDASRKAVSELNRKLKYKYPNENERLVIVEEHFKKLQGSGLVGAGLVGAGLVGAGLVERGMEEDYYRYY